MTTVNEICTTGWDSANKPARKRETVLKIAWMAMGATILKRAKFVPRVKMTLTPSKMRTYVHGVVLVQPGYKNSGACHPAQSTAKSNVASAGPKRASI